MSNTTYTVLDLATYDFIEIDQPEIPVFTETTAQSTDQPSLVAKWIRDDTGKLYCSWTSV